MSVYKKLMQARIELQSRVLSKTGENKFAGYRYFTLADFLPACQEIFNGLGLCGIVSYSKETATLTIVDTDGGGEIVICTPMSDAALKGCHPVQNLGAVETYIRRYLWVTAMEIVEHDAMDATTLKGESKGSISPNDGAIENLPVDLQTAAKDDADALVQMWESDKDAAFNAYLSLLEGDSEYMLAVWAFLKPHSKIRSGLKAMKAEKV